MKYHHPLLCIDISVKRFNTCGTVPFVSMVLCSFPLDEWILNCFHAQNSDFSTAHDYTFPNSSVKCLPLT